MRRAVVPTSPAGERLLFLEGMRGILALYVAVGHVFTMVDPSTMVGRPSTAPLWMQRLSWPFLHGHVAVALFIVVSGFSLGLGTLQGGGNGTVASLSSFFKRRAWRILPAYYASLLVSAIVAWKITPRFPYPPFTLYLPLNRDTLLSHLFLVHNLVPGWMLKINGVLWTVAAEAQLYLAFPLLARLQNSRGRGMLLLAGLLIWAGLQGALTPVFAAKGIVSPSYLRLWYVFLFTVGMAGAHLAYRPPLWTGRPSPWLGVIGWIALFSALVALALTRLYAVSDVPFGIALACLCALGAVGGGGRLVRFFGLRPLAWLGGISYSLYLMHHPVEQIVYALRPAFVEGSGGLLAWLLGVGLPLMLLVAWLFSLGFERPFLRRRSRRAPRGRRIVPGVLPLPGGKSPTNDLTA